MRDFRTGISFSVRGVVNTLGTLGVATILASSCWWCDLASASTGLNWVESAERSKSTFAVVTQKGGVAAALAHNHFIQAKNYELNVTEGSTPLTPASVQMKFKVKDLEVDNFSYAEPAGIRLLELGIQHAQFSKLSDSDQKTITENMLAKDQLWAEKYPTIEVIATGFRSKPGKIGTKESNYEADFEFKIRDKSVKKTAPILVSQSESELGGVKMTQIEIEGLILARFDEFGFKAYSGLLGTVKNKDEFHFYFKTQGTWKP